jgi:hypothetical protein
MSFETSSVAITVFAMIAVLIGVAVCSCLPGKRRDHCFLFALALLLRSGFCYGSWLLEAYTDHPQQSIFNSDATRYYEDSFEPLDSNLLTRYNDAGWMTYSHYATAAAEYLGEPHALANTQMVLLTSALIPPLLSAILWTLGLAELSWAAGLAMSLHPMLIAYSSSLLRDQTVSCLGVLMLLVLAPVAIPRARFRVARLVGGIGLGAVLWEIRSASALFFIAASCLLAYSLRQQHNGTHGVRASSNWLSRPFTVILVGFVIYYVVQNRLVPHTGDRDQRTEAYVEEAGANSLGADLLGRGGLVNWGASAAQVIAGPVPWYYSWSMTQQSVADVFVGAGAVINQFLLAFVVVGGVVAARRGNFVISACGLIAVFYIILAVDSYTDPARYSSTHLLPFYVILGLYGLRHSAHPIGPYAISAFVTVMPTYLAYILLKESTSAVTGTLLMVPISALVFAVAHVLRSQLPHTLKQRAIRPANVPRPWRYASAESADGTLTPS